MITHNKMQVQQRQPLQAQHHRIIIRNNRCRLQVREGIRFQRCITDINNKGNLSLVILEDNNKGIGMGKAELIF